MPSISMFTTNQSVRRQRQGQLHPRFTSTPCKWVLTFSGYRLPSPQSFIVVSKKFRGTWIVLCNLHYDGRPSLVHVSWLRQLHVGQWCGYTWIFLVPCTCQLVQCRHENALLNLCQSCCHLVTRTWMRISHDGNILSHGTLQAPSASVIHSWCFQRQYIHAGVVVHDACATITMRWTKGNSDELTSMFEVTLTRRVWLHGHDIITTVYNSNTTTAWPQQLVHKRLACTRLHTSLQQA